MAYRVVNVPWDEDELWGSRLLQELAHQEAEGFTLAAMTPRTVQIQSYSGAPTRYAIMLVCVFHREGEP